MQAEKVSDTDALVELVRVGLDDLPNLMASLFPNPVAALVAIEVLRSDLRKIIALKAPSVAARIDTLVQEAHARLCDADLISDEEASEIVASSNDGEASHQFTLSVSSTGCTVMARQGSTKGDVAVQALIALARFVAEQCHDLPQSVTDLVSRFLRAVPVAPAEPVS